MAVKGMSTVVDATFVKSGATAATAAARRQRFDSTTPSRLDDQLLPLRRAARSEVGLLQAHSASMCSLRTARWADGPSPPPVRRRRLELRKQSDRGKEPDQALMPLCGPRELGFIRGCHFNAHDPNGGSSGHGQVRLESDVSMLDWFTVTAERIRGKSYRWYVNGKLYMQASPLEVFPRSSRRPSRPC
jgi:hypothetical protein